MSREGIEAIRAYLLTHLDDPYNGTPGEVDPLEVAAFLNAEGVHFSGSMRMREETMQVGPGHYLILPRPADPFVIPTFLYVPWREAFARRLGAPSILTVSYEAFSQLLAGLSPRGGVTEAGLPRRPAEGGGTLPMRRVLAVGDAYASRETNSPLTVRLARPNMPTTREYVIPVDPRHEMVATVAFDSVDWSRDVGDRDPRTVRPSQAFICPTDYHGPLPPTPDSIAEWRRLHAARYGDRSPFGLDPARRLDSRRRPHTFFFDVSPVRPGNSSVTVRMPPGSYQLVVQAGERSGHRDRFDNFVTTLSGENLRPDPEFGASLARTILLGEEVYRITEPQSDGTLRPLPLLPETSDAGTHLYAQAYVQFHPVARDLLAPANRDMRVFHGLRRGRRYTFSTKVRGIDTERFSVELHNGPERIRLPQATTSSVPVSQEAAEAMRPIEALLARLAVSGEEQWQPSVRPWQHASFQGWLFDDPREPGGAGRLVRVLVESDEISWQYHVSVWGRDGGGTPDRFLGRSLPLPRGLEAKSVMQYLLDHLKAEGRGVAGAPFWNGYREGATSVRRSAKDRIEQTFVAKDETVVAVFTSHAVEQLVRRDHRGWPIGDLPLVCDELRFDEIQLVGERGEDILPTLK